MSGESSILLPFFTYDGFRTWLLELLDDDFHLGRQRQQITMFFRADDDGALVGAWDFSDTSKVGPITICRHRPVVKNSARSLVLEHPPFFAETCIYEP